MISFQNEVNKCVFIGGKTKIKWKLWSEFDVHNFRKAICIDALCTFYGVWCLRVTASKMKWSNWYYDQNDLQIKQYPLLIAHCPNIELLLWVKSLPECRHPIMEKYNKHGKLDVKWMHTMYVYPFRICFGSLWIASTERVRFKTANRHKRTKRIKGIKRNEWNEMNETKEMSKWK